MCASGAGMAMEDVTPDCDPGVIIFHVLFFITQAVSAVADVKFSCIQLLLHDHNEYHTHTHLASTSMRIL